MNIITRHVDTLPKNTWDTNSAWKTAVKGCIILESFSLWLQKNVANQAILSTINVSKGQIVSKANFLVLI